MNITIILDNSRLELLDSNGASIILKLYLLAIDPNNTLTLEGNIDSTTAYGYLVDYLNTNYGPDFKISVANRYVKFEDNAVLNILKSSIGDGVGVSETQLSNLTNVTSLGFVNNTDITDFREGCLLTNLNIYIKTGFINGCTNLDIVGMPPYLTNYAQFTTLGCRPSKIVISNWGNWVATSFGNGNDLCNKDNHDLCTLNADNSLTIVKNVTLPQGCDFHNQRAMCGGFYKSTVEEVSLPESVTRLADFLWSKILTINFPQNSGLTKIFEYCFYECTDLTLDVSTLPQSITHIGEGAFLSCTNVTGALNLPNLTYIGNSVFRNANVTSISNLGSITNIPARCFLDCTNLTSIVFPLSLTSIEESAFESTNISSITIPNSVKKCASNFVSNTVVSEIIFPEGITQITGGQFYTKNNALTYIELPSTVLDMDTFFHRSLETSQDNLCTVVIKATTPPVLWYRNEDEAWRTMGIKFSGIYVPDASLTAYQNGANAWLHSSILEKLKPISLLLTDNPTAWAKYNRS